MAGILPLQLPDWRPAPQIDWSPLSRLGQMIAAGKEAELDRAMRQRALDIQAASQQSEAAHRAGTLGLAQRKFKEEQANTAKEEKRKLDNERMLRDLLSPQPSTPGPQSSLEPASFEERFAAAYPGGLQVAQSAGSPSVNVDAAVPDQSAGRQSAIDRLQKALLVPDLSPGAKALIEHRLKAAQGPALEQEKATAKATAKEAVERHAAFPQALKSVQLSSNAWDMVVGATEELGLGEGKEARMREATDRRTGAISRNNPLGEGWTWSARLASLKNKLAINAIQAMREASKTGGAAGTMTEREWPIFMEQIDALDPNMGPDEFKKSLRNINRHAKRMKAISHDAFYRTYPNARNDETIDLNPPISLPEEGNSAATGERTTKSGVKWSF